MQNQSKSMLVGQTSCDALETLWEIGALVVSTTSFIFRMPKIETSGNIWKHLARHWQHCRNFKPVPERWCAPCTRGFVIRTRQVEIQRLGDEVASAASWETPRSEPEDLSVGDKLPRKSRSMQHAIYEYMNISILIDAIYIYTYWFVAYWCLLHPNPFLMHWLIALDSSCIALYLCRRMYLGFYACMSMYVCAYGWCRVSCKHAYHTLVNALVARLLCMQEFTNSASAMQSFNAG